MDTTKYLKENEQLTECYEIHNHYYRDWTIGDFEHFDTLEDAIESAKARLTNDENKEIRQVEIRRFFKKDGHICYDGTHQQYVKRA